MLTASDIYTRAVDAVNTKDEAALDRVTVDGLCLIALSLESIATSLKSISGSLNDQNDNQRQIAYGVSDVAGSIRNK